MAAIACHKNAPRDGVYNLKLTSAQAGNVRQQLPFLPEHPHLSQPLSQHRHAPLRLPVGGAGQSRCNRCAQEGQLTGTNLTLCAHRRGHQNSAKAQNSWLTKDIKSRS